MWNVNMDIRGEMIHFNNDTMHITTHNQQYKNDLGSFREIPYGTIQWLEIK